MISVTTLGGATDERPRRRAGAACNKAVGVAGAGTRKTSKQANRTRARVRARVLGRWPCGRGAGRRGLCDAHAHRLLARSKRARSLADSRVYKNVRHHPDRWWPAVMLSSSFRRASSSVGAMVKT